MRRWDLWLPDEDSATTHAELRDACRRTGHALHAKEHEADRWVAVAAIELGLPLVTHDAVFRGAPGLDVVCLAP